MTCWSCGRAVELAAAQKINRGDTCACDADLRVCRNCRHFDPRAHNQCREVMAEWVRDKDRANHCDYFAPAGSSPASGGDYSGAGDARSQFDRLFGK